LNHNLFSLLRTRFPKESETPFIITPEGRVLPYSAVDELTARLAGALQQLGLARGERIAMLIDKSPEAILLYLAVLRLGAILVPLNTAYTAREFRYFLNDAQPRVVILRPDLDPEKHQAALDAGARTATLDASNGGSLAELAIDTQPLNEIEAVNNDDLAAILYTSGTTGQPKGAMLTHGNLASNGLALHRIWGFRPGDVLLHPLPVFHVHGLFVAVHCAMLNGSPILYLPKFDAAMVTDQLPHATVMMGVPTFYSRLLEHEAFNRSACENIRLFISGSAPLLPQTWEAFHRQTGHKILERYGMSEAGMIASNPLDGDRLPGTVGFPLPKIKVRISDRNGNPLPRGETGVLEVKGPNLFPGYWGKPEMNMTEFRADGFFISGDLATMNDDCRITIVGRDRDLVITGGFNVYPKEVEDYLNQLPGIKESAVIGVPHPDFGEALVALIAGERNTAPGEQAVISALKRNLAGFKVPRRVIRLDALPKNSMGKVQKNTLRETYADVIKN
jgi:malonyl-CoA/methylmalonyl-CoA synthetase